VSSLRNEPSAATPAVPHIGFDIFGDGLRRPDQFVLECDPGSRLDLDERTVLQHAKYDRADDDCRNRSD
jgi:hypothetical protein